MKSRLLLFVLFTSPALSKSISPDPTAGFWLSQDGGTILEISICGKSICGRPVWFKSGNIVIVYKQQNSDESKRRLSLCGMNLFKGFQRKSSGVWINGKIEDPTIGETIGPISTFTTSSSLVFRSENDSQSAPKTWQRVPPPSLKCLK